MRMNRPFLIGILSVIGLFVLSLNLTPFVNVFHDKSWAADRASSRGVIAKSSTSSRETRDRCSVPPTWGDRIEGKKRWVKKWDGDAYCDRMTGLVWEASPGITAMSWGEAQFYCLNRTVEGDNGIKGWRMASVPELASLVDSASRSCKTGGGCLPDGAPFKNVQIGPYWAGSTFPGFPNQAWFVGFDIGNVDCCLDTSTTLPAWCVRGASYADAY